MIELPGTDRRKPELIPGFSSACATRLSGGMVRELQIQDVRSRKSPRSKLRLQRLRAPRCPRKLRGCIRRSRASPDEAGRRGGRFRRSRLAETASMSIGSPCADLLDHAGSCLVRDAISRERAFMLQRYHGQQPWSSQGRFLAVCIDCMALRPRPVEGDRRKFSSAMVTSRPTPCLSAGCGSGLMNVSVAVGGVEILVLGGPVSCTSLVSRRSPRVASPAH